MAETRAQSFEGEIRKCPNCGAVLPSMVAHCPECGFELRNTGMSSTLKQFYQDLKDGDDMQDIETISNFPVPNNKEDFLEFVVMAKGEIGKDYDIDNAVERQKHEAWVSKFKQCKAKAPLLFANDEKTLLAVNKLFDETKLKKKISAKTLKIRGIVLGAIALVGIILTIIFYEDISIDHHNKRIDRERTREIANAISNFEDFVIPQNSVQLPGSMKNYFEIASDLNIALPKEVENSDKIRIVFDFDISCKKSLKEALEKQAKTKWGKIPSAEISYSCKFEAVDNDWSRGPTESILLEMQAGEKTHIHHLAEINPSYAKGALTELKEAKNSNFFVFHSLYGHALAEYYANDDAENKKSESFDIK